MEDDWKARLLAAKEATTDTVAAAAAAPAVVVAAVGGDAAAAQLEPAATAAAAPQRAKSVCGSQSIGHSSKENTPTPPAAHQGGGGGGGGGGCCGVPGVGVDEEEDDDGQGEGGAAPESPPMAAEHEKRPLSAGSPPAPPDGEAAAKRLLEDKSPPAGCWPCKPAARAWVAPSDNASRAGSLPSGCGGELRGGSVSVSSRASGKPVGLFPPAAQPADADTTTAAGGGGGCVDPPPAAGSGCGTATASTTPLSCRSSHSAVEAAKPALLFPPGAARAATSAATTVEDADEASQQSATGGGGSVGGGGGGGSGAPPPPAQSSTSSSAVHPRAVVPGGRPVGGIPAALESDAGDAAAAPHAVHGQQQALQPRPRPIDQRPSYLLSKQLLTMYKRINEKYFAQFRQESLKRSTAEQGQTLYNNGYDDEHGNYLVVVGEELNSRYLITGVLGRGSFGVVAKGLDTRERKQVALKIVKNKRAFSKQADIEINLLFFMNRYATDECNVVKIYDHFVWNGHSVIVIELCCVNLFELLRLTGMKGVPLKPTSKLACELLVTLNFLMQLRIVHCDLKPENILLRSRESSSIKVIDFSSSCQKGATMYTYIQTRFYRAPEVILGIPYSHPIDMWSLGAILVEMHTGKPLFEGHTELEQINKIEEVLGPLPQSLLRRASKEKLEKLFTRVPLPEGEKRSEGDAEEAAVTYTVKKVEGMAALPPLAELLRERSAVHSEGPQLFECFLDAVRKMLDYEPDDRMTPEQGLSHPFVTSVCAYSVTLGQTTAKDVAEKIDREKRRERRSGSGSGPSQESSPASLPANPAGPAPRPAPEGSLPTDGPSVSSGCSSSGGGGGVPPQGLIARRPEAEGNDPGPHGRPTRAQPPTQPHVLRGFSDARSDPPAAGPPSSAFSHYMHTATSPGIPYARQMIGALNLARPDPAADSKDKASSTSSDEDQEDDTSDDNHDDTITTTTNEDEEDEEEDESDDSDSDTQDEEEDEAHALPSNPIALPLTAPMHHQQQQPHPVQPPSHPHHHHPPHHHHHHSHPQAAPQLPQQFVVYHGPHHPSQPAYPNIGVNNAGMVGAPGVYGLPTQLPGSLVPQATGNAGMGMQMQVQMPPVGMQGHQDRRAMHSVQGHPHHHHHHHNPHHAPAIDALSMGGSYPNIPMAHHHVQHVQSSGIVHQLSHHQISHHQISHHQISHHQISHHQMSHHQISHHQIGHHQLHMQPTHPQHAMKQRLQHGHSTPSLPHVAHDMPSSSYNPPPQLHHQQHHHHPPHQQMMAPQHQMRYSQHTRPQQQHPQHQQQPPAQRYMPHNAAHAHASGMPGSWAPS